MTTLVSTMAYTNTLMQTALVTASGPTTRCPSARPYRYRITKDIHYAMLNNNLQLKAVQNEILDVTTFGSTRGTPKSYEVVTLTLNAVNKDVKITALVHHSQTPNIRKSLLNSKLSLSPIQ